MFTVLGDVLSEGLDLDDAAFKVLEITEQLIGWGIKGFPDELRRSKWQLLAKRLQSAQGSDLQEFIHNVVKDIAGDRYFLPRKEKGNELSQLLSRFKGKIGAEKELIRYIRARAYPLVVRYAAGAREEE